MTTTIFGKLIWAIMAVVLTVVAVTTVTMQEGGGPERSLTGVWEVTTTPRDCATGDPVPARSFRSIWTFHQDGTMSATNVPVTLAAPPPSTATLTRTASYGIWERELGWSDYKLKFLHLRYDGQTRAFVGKQEGDGTLALTDSGDEFTSDGTATVFDMNDNPGTPGCANSVGRRFRLNL